MSGLYFRGKLTYAHAFGRAPAALGSGSFVITPTRGLQAPETPVTREVVHEFASLDVNENDRRYRIPLERDAAQLAARTPSDVRFVFLGSLATRKYLDPLVGTLGPRLYYPPAFVGRGDMSRGGLLLRSVESRVELEYAVLHADVERHGPRPPKLEPLRKTRQA
jgi:hypothetical protein